MFISSQLLLGWTCILRFELLDSLDEVRLLQTSVARLIPIVENLLQILHLQLLQVDRVEIDLLFVFQVADLLIFLFQLFADLVGRHRPAERFGHFAENASRGIFEAAEIVAETILSALDGFAELSELGLDLLGVLAHCIVEILGEFVEYANADLTFALL